MLIFVATKREADALDDYLYAQGIPTTSIHGDRTQVEREKALFNFKAGNTPVLVATDVASRGLDIPDVNQVINYDMPKNIEDYVHRYAYLFFIIDLVFSIGRTGRAGHTGKATSFYSYNDSALANALVKTLEATGQAVPSFLGGGGVGGDYYGDNNAGTVAGW